MVTSDQHQITIDVGLRCCGARISLKLSKGPLARRLLNERRKNVICAGCGTLVILAFEPNGNTADLIDQEVISFDAR